MPELSLDPPPLSLALTSELTSCEAARQAVVGFLARHQPSAKAIYQVELVLEEALMNQICHAFPDKRPDHPLQLRAEVANDSVVLTFSDKGLPFNPLDTRAPAFPTRLEEATPGGLGIFLTRKYAQSLAYQRLGDENQLTVVLGLRDPPAT